LGNIVRSPLAENLFRYTAEQLGIAGRYEVDSAGTSDYHIGESPDPRMRRIAARYGLEYDGRARQISRQDLENFDLIIAMDVENAESLKRMARTPQQEAKVHLLREYDSQASPKASVPDPYYEGMDGFENVYQVIERSVKGLITTLEGEARFEQE
jgi:protein-tyrosine phosphatase